MAKPNVQCKYNYKLGSPRGCIRSQHSGYQVRRTPQCDQWEILGHSVANPSSLGEQPGVQIESMGSMASMPFNGVNGFNEAQRPSRGSKASKVRLAGLEVDREILRPSICRKQSRGETPRKCCNCATMTIKGNNINRIHRSIYWGCCNCATPSFLTHCIQWCCGTARHNILLRKRLIKSMT